MADTTTPDALELRGLRKTFRTGLFGRGPRVHALGGLDLTVPSGTVHALLGPNGAGKTTAVRAVATLLRPDEGTVLVDGVDALAEPAAVREIIGVSGQYAAVDGNLTGYENLRMVGQLYGQTRSEAGTRARRLITELNLDDAADRPMRTYSGGMRRRLDLAGALINQPSLVILDEPTTGLDPRGRRMMWDVITQQVHNGATVLLTTQYLEEADALADQITVIDHGTIRAQGSASELKAATGGSILTLEIAPADDGRPVTDNHVAAVLSEIGIGHPERLDDEPVGPGEHGPRWSVAVDGGTRSAVAAVKDLSSAGIDVLDASVSTPTLDDVFLALTERTEEAASDLDHESAYIPDESDTTDAEGHIKPKADNKFDRSDDITVPDTAELAHSQHSDRSENVHVH
ncbi:ABC transporter ATP-binding protein [Gordonia aurantiaca]|uniref:ABC transporter ATP-binding protein n=1 Tax=Gordonia sp. B21 TaxID=3151852 RepID=UPI003266897E